MIYRIYPLKDAWITNRPAEPFTTRLTGSNTGFSEELNVFKISPISGAVGSLGSSSLGRALLQFDFTQFTQLTASGDIPSSGLTYTLRLNHLTHGGTQPYSFDMSAYPLQGPWDEGRGLDSYELGDSGVVNWVQANLSRFWTAPGGDIFGSPTSSVHFDTGLENFEADLTTLTNFWLQGAIGNYGTAIAMVPAVESDSNFGNFYNKKFYSRHTHYPDRGPYLEARVNDFKADDRMNMRWSRTGTLYYYNVIGGAFQDLVGAGPYVSIGDKSGTLLHLTASRAGTGVYTVPFALPTGSYSGSVFFDSWGSGSFALTTGTFGFTSAGGTNTLSPSILTGRVRNLQDEYAVDDLVTFQVNFRPSRGHTSPVLSTASLNRQPYIVETAYYAIDNYDTRERVVPFGTGSQQHTRVSYDGNGNYFRFPMANLHGGNVYKVVFLVFDQGRHQVIDSDIRFKVVS